MEDWLGLDGWSNRRRVVIVRVRIRDGVARERRDERGQLCPALAAMAERDGQRLWEYSVWSSMWPEPLTEI